MRFLRKVRFFRVLPVCCVVTFLIAPRTGSAQLLRLGGFDVSPSSALEFIYTTNVEGERESESVLEREDAYLVFSIGTSISATPRPEWALSTELNVEVERHLERKDLDSDTLSDLFGDFDFLNEAQRGRYTFTLFANGTRSRETSDDIFISGSVKTRNPQTELSAGGSVLWDFREWVVGADYEYNRLRHDDAEFKSGDEDKQDAGAFLRYDVNSRVALGYEYERTRSDFPNDPENDGDGIWLESQFFGLDVLLIPNRNPLPELTYTLGYEKQDEVTRKGRWQVTHTLKAQQEWNLTGRTRAFGSMNYEFKEDPAEDDIAFTYEVGLRNQFSRTTGQELTLTREPRRTFGSTQDTDSTKVAWTVTKNEFLLREISISGGITWTRDIPVDDPEERALRYEVGAEHVRRLSRRLSRIIAYDYYLEDLNTETEKLDEHRVSLLFDYSF